MNVRMIISVSLLLFSIVAKGQGAFQFSACDSTLRIAIKKFVVSDFKEVLRLAEDAEQCYAQDSLYNGWIASLNIKTRAYYQMHELDSAMMISKQAMAMSETLPVFPYIKMGTHFHLGTITYDNGDYEGALPHLLDALERLEETEAYIDGQMTEAEKQNENVRLVKALVKITEEVFVLSKGYLYNYLGLCYQELSDLDQAITYFKMGREFFAESRKTNDFFQQRLEAQLFEQVCNYHIGLCYTYMKDYEESNKFVRMAIDGLEESMILKFFAVVGRFFESIGDNNVLSKKALPQNVNNYKKAIKVYENAAPFTFTSGGTSREEALAGAMTKLAVAYFPSNKDSSLYYLNQSLQFFNDIEAKGIRYYQPSKAGLLIRLAELYNKHEQATKALELYRDALMILNEGFDPDNLFENPDAEGAIFERYMLKAYREKGAILKQLAASENNPLFLDYALESYERAIHILDEMRKNFTRGSLSRIMREEAILDLEYLSDNIYEEAISVAYELSKQSGPKAASFRYKAFEISEKSKAFALRAAIFRLDAFQAMPPELLQRERRLKAELFLSEKKWKQASKDKLETQAALFRERRASAKQQLEAFVDSLKNNPATRAYYDLQYNDQIYAIKDIQNQLLDDSTAIVEYLTGNKELFGFVITKNDFQLFSRSMPADLEGQIRSLRDTLQSPRLLRPETGGDYIQLAFGLDSLLMAPARERLPSNIKKLIIVPHGALHHLNFEFLIKERPALPAPKRPHNFGTFAYLLYDYTFSYINSVSILMDRKLRAPRPLQLKPLQFAGFSPDYSNTRYAPLADELKAAAKWLDSEQSTLYYGPEAGERRLRELLRNYAPNILHLNAHGLLYDEDPLRSHILLHNTPDSLEDNQLRVGELYNLIMDVDLAVLSACNSGYSNSMRNGEGVISLARGFQYAGVKQVLMSLWPIDSEATAILMEAFYEGLIAKQLSPDAALRYAKKTYLEKVEGLERRSPYYWSGLILLGSE